MEMFLSVRSTHLCNQEGDVNCIPNDYVRWLLLQLLALFIDIIRMYTKNRYCEDVA